MKHRPAIGLPSILPYASKISLTIFVHNNDVENVKKFKRYDVSRFKVIYENTTEWGRGGGGKHPPPSRDRVKAKHMKGNFRTN